MLKYMLDTNIIIYIIKRKPIELLHTFNSHTGLLCISAISHGEMQHGIEKSSNPAKNRSTYNDFISRLEILDYGQRAAEHCGDIRAYLEKRGKVIGVNDLQIAAHARSEGLVIVTNNVKEFERVDGLRTENWLDQA
jgi:tRNA(fMet)-specific endonuclease VapC